MKWLKNRAERSFIFPAIIPALYLFVKLKYLYIQYAWISTMKKQKNSNHSVKVEKMVEFVETFDHYHQKFNFRNFFSCPVKLLKNLKLGSKFNHSLKHHGYLHSTIWKALYNFKIKKPRKQVVTNFSFKMFKICRFLRSSKCSKIIAEKRFTVVFGLFVLFSTGNIPFEYIWSKGSKLSGKAKLGTWTNSSMQNSMVILTFSIFGQKRLFGRIWYRGVAIVGLGWSLGRGATIVPGVFGTGSGFCVVQRNAGKFYFLFFRGFFPSVIKIFILGRVLGTRL